MTEHQANHADVIQCEIMVLGYRNYLLWPKTTTKGMPPESTLDLAQREDLGLRISRHWGRKPTLLHIASTILRLFDDDFIPPRTSRTFHFFELTS